MTTAQATVSPQTGLAKSARAALILAFVVVAMDLWLAFTAPEPFYLAPFRESQTAISADYLIREPAGGMLAYQVPVLGSPWRVPYEFPLFQQVTAWIAEIGIPVSLAGRLLSLACAVAFLAALLQLLKAWNTTATLRMLLLACLLASPLYCTYATSHMIESMALLAAVLYLWTAWKWAQNGGFGWLALALFTGVLAGLIKLTTWLPAGLMVGLLMLAEFDKGRKRAPATGRWRVSIGLFILSLASFAAAIAWSKWTEKIRDRNPLVHESMSWFFGTISQRFSPKNWVWVLGKQLMLLFGPVGFLVPIFIGFAWLKGPRGSARNYLALALVAYLLHTAIFFSLHMRHEYYVYGAGVYLVIALIFSLHLMHERKPSGWIRWCPPILIVSMAIGMLGYNAIKQGYHDLSVDWTIKAVEGLKQPGALLMFGYDWSPAVPYAVGRKALMIVEDGENPTVLANNKDTKFAAAVVLGSENVSKATFWCEKFGLDPTRRYYFCRNGFIALPKGASMAANEIADSPVLKDLGKLIPSNSKLHDGLIFKRLSFSGGSLDVVVKRGPDAFYLHNLSLFRAREYFGQE